jgi:hypothetical protein
MENIKKQIVEICNFNPCNDLESIAETKIAISNRIQSGINDMTASNLFTKQEIGEISEYANHIINMKYNEAYNNIKAELRKNYKF